MTRNSIFTNLIRRGAALYALLLMFLGPVFAQEPVLSVQAPKSVPAGQVFEITYAINVRGSKSFQAPSFKGLEILYGPMQSQSSSFQFINGKRSQSFNLSFTYGLSAPEEGSYTLEPASIVVDGKTYQSETVTIEAGPARQASGNNRQGRAYPSSGNMSPGSQPGQAGQNRQSASQRRQDLPPEVSDQDLFILVQPDKTNPYVGEQVLLNYRIYTSVPVEQFSIYKTPSNKGFWVDELEVDPQSQQQEIIDGKPYVYADIRRVALFPQNDGSHTVEPMEVEALAQVSVQRQPTSIWDIFDDPFFAPVQTVKKELKTKSLRINARSLPQEGKPLSFDGLVGQYDIHFDYEPKILKTNEAITFRFVVEGKGNIDMIHAPQIQFPPDFEVYEPKISYDKKTDQNGVKGKAVFEYIVVPRHPGIYKVNAFSYSFFNPVSEKYVEENIPEMVLNVEAGKDAVLATPAQGEGQGGSDIAYIKPTVSQWQPIGKNFLFSGAFWTFLLAELVLFGLFLLFQRLHAQNKADIAGLKNRKAAKEAKRCLKKAALLLKEQKKEDFFIEISQALWGFLANKFNIPPANLSMDTVRMELASHQVPDDLAEQFIRTLDHCEFERFSPQSSGSEGMKRMYEEAYEIIYKITGAIK